MPTWGWTEDGKVVPLAGKISPSFSPIKMVTKEGWSEWYYVELGEYKARPKSLGHQNRLPKFFKES